MTAADKFILALEAHDIPRLVDAIDELRALDANGVARLQNVEFENLNFNNFNLGRVEFDGCTFIGCTFKQGAFHEGVVKNCEFTACNLENVTFFDSNLANTTFLKCNLTKAVFRKANLVGAHFQACNLEAANFTGAVLHATNCGPIVRFVNCTHESVAPCFGDTVGEVRTWQAAFRLHFISAPRDKRQKFLDAERKCSFVREAQDYERDRPFPMQVLANNRWILGNEFGEPSAFVLAWRMGIISQNELGKFARSINAK